MVREVWCDQVQARSERKVQRYVSNRRRWTLGLVASVLMAGIGIVAAAPAWAAAPPWESDPNSLGSVVFYDASGNVLTGGSDLTHIADYVAATTAGTAGATKANLVFANPNPAQPTGNWTTGSGSASKTYPDATAPAPIQGPGFTFPVVSLSAAADEGDLAVFIQTVVANTDPAYVDIYQIRIKDSGPGGISSGSHYWESDISVDSVAGTWTLLYPQSVTPASMTISANKTIKYGTSTTTSTTLKDSTTNAVISNASVKLYKRASTSASWAFFANATTNGSGVASKSVSPKGKTLYQWRYAGDGTHEAATSPTQTVLVKQVVSAHSTKSTVAHGVAFKIYGTVKPASGGQTVTLQRKVGTSWNSIASATIKKQPLPNGTTTVGFVFTAKQGTAGTYNYRVRKAATATLLAGVSATLTVKVT